MPDILIRGMEMPTEGGAIGIYKISGNFYAARVGKDELFPIVELPPHGDLILKDDAIVAVKLLSDLYPEYRRILAVLWDQIKDLTVIIPKSEEVTNDPKP